MTGSRRLRFADAMSIFARSTRSRFLSSPAMEDAVRLGGKARQNHVLAAGLDDRRYDAANESPRARAGFSAAVLLRHLPPQAWTSSRGCAPKPCILSAHCSPPTTPITDC